MYDLKSQLISDRENYEMSYIKNQIIAANRCGDTSLKISRGTCLKDDFVQYLLSQGIQTMKTSKGYLFDWIGMVSDEESNNDNE